MLTVFVIIFWLRCNSSFWWKKITLLLLNRKDEPICLFASSKIFFYSNEQRDWLYLMSVISCVPCWLAVIGIQAQLLFKKSCLWEKKQASGCQWGFLWTYCHSLDNLFYSQSNWIWSKVWKELNSFVGDRESHLAWL